MLGDLTELEHQVSDSLQMYKCILEECLMSFYMNLYGYNRLLFFNGCTSNYNKKETWLVKNKVKEAFIYFQIKLFFRIHKFANNFMF